jgi:hypothetical protein
MLAQVLGAAELLAAAATGEGSRPGSSVHAAAEDPLQVFHKLLARFGEKPDAQQQTAAVGAHHHHLLQVGDRKPAGA